MKKIMVSLVLFVTVSSVFGQDEEAQKGFKKENLFTGGSVTLSFYSGGFLMGANPIFGYQLTKWADAGIALNYTYVDQTDVYGTKIRQHVLGGGLFTRLYPLPFLFLQGQFEHNFIGEKDTYVGGYTAEFKGDANSLLVGGGWAQGRQPGSNSFFYISILFDVIKNSNSPYVTNVYDQSTGLVVRSDAYPIFRAGVNIALFQRKNNNRNNDEPGNGRRQPHTYQGY
jgi:hypothetical protein